MNKHETISSGGMVTFALDIVRHVSVFLLAQIASRIISFVYMLYLAASLPTDTFGALNIALTVLVVADVFADLGLSRLVVKTISRDKAVLSIYPARLILLRLLLAFLAFVLCMGAVQLKDFGPEVSAFLVIIGLGLVVTGASSILEAVLQSQSNFGIIGLGHVGLSIVQAATGYWVVSTGESSSALAITFLISNLAYMALLLTGVLYRHGLSMPVLAPDFWLEQLKLSLPYAGIAIVSIIAMRGEMLIMSWISSAEQVAYFSVAARLNDAAVLGPIVLATVLIPQFSRHHHDAPGTFSQSYRTVLRWGLIIAIPASAIAALLVEPVLMYFLPTYALSAHLTSILFMAMPMFAIYQLNSAVFLSSDQQKRALVALLALLVLQLLVGIVLVRDFSAFGAAIAYAVWTTIAALISTLLAKQWYMKDLALLPVIAPPIAGAAMMSIGLWLAQDTHIAFKICVAAAAYAAGVFAVMRFENAAA
ncbi:MAG: oligosaccharide flippase family protein [Beijerinckiaceae bacterium]